MADATLYDDDVYAWAYEQVDILRRMAAAGRGLPNALDVENICEEIEGVARTELREAESFLRLVLVHLLKIASASGSRPSRHWMSEARTFQRDLRKSTTRSIRNKLDLDDLWLAAVDRAGGQLDLEGDAILPGLSVDCPLGLDDLLAEPFDVDAALDIIRRSAAADQP